MFYNKTNSWANPVLEIMGSFKELKPQAEKKKVFYISHCINNSRRISLEVSRHCIFT